jgi:hypothetical protein
MLHTSEAQHGSQRDGEVQGVSSQNETSSVKNKIHAIVLMKGIKINDECKPFTKQFVEEIKAGGRLQDLRISFGRRISHRTNTRSFKEDLRLKHPRTTKLLSF